MSEHPEFDCIIAQMRALEAVYLANADQPVTGKDILPVCEAIRLLATKMADFVPSPGTEDLTAVTEMAQ